LTLQTLRARDQVDLRQRSRVEGSVVELGGDEMTRIIKDKLILLYLDVNLVVCCSEAKAASSRRGQLCVDFGISWGCQID